MKTLVLLVSLAGCFESNVVGDDSIDIGDADPTATHPGAVPRPGGPAPTPSMPAGSPYRPGDRVDLGGADVVVVGPDGSEAAQQVVMPGDMDGDGLAEVVFMTYRWAGRDAPIRHAVSIVYGRADLPSTIALSGADATFVSGPTSSSGGNSIGVAGVGDLDGDGLADLLVCVPGLFLELGRAHVIYGSVERYRGERSFDEVGVSLTDGVAGGRFGISVAGVGDLDGDSFDDFVVGAGNEDLPGPFRVDLYYGSPAMHDAGAAASLLGPDGEIIGGYFGGLGDVDGDGLDDFAVLSSAHFGGGQRALLIRGSSVRLSGSLRVDEVGVEITTPESPTGFGLVGDLDADALDDFAIRAAGLDAAHVFHGDATRWSEPFSFEEAETTYVLPTTGGGAFARGGDVNGDGHADFLVGDGLAGEQRGAAYLVYGDGTRRVGTLDLATEAVAFLGRQERHTETPTHDVVGWSIAAGHDINGDGLDDFVLAAPGDGALGGRAYIVFGIAER